MKKVTDREKRSKTLSEVKPVENKSKKLHSPSLEKSVFVSGWGGLVGVFRTMS